MKIFIATFPFGQCSKEPLKVLENSGFKIEYNSLGRRLKAGEVEKLVYDADGIIAGTEPYTSNVIEKCKNLKVISRVGVGLDNIDFQSCSDNNVIVTYTPEAPSDGVADLTIAQMINLFRGIQQSDRQIRSGVWHRVMGKLLSEIKIGVLGVGRIGKRVIRRLQPFGTDVYACDIVPDLEFGRQYNIRWVTKIDLFRECDLVTFHIPMNKNNYHCVGFKELSEMKEGAFVINTSRGPIIDENALVSLLLNKHLGGAALDVFIDEPYSGPLCEMDNVVLTAHIGASAKQSRYLMELGAATDCVKVLQGKVPDNPVTWKDFE